ncbi:hypothetical protein pdam_00004083 [Pocillopora damicornis]|uniref:Uncharacterized protein n=1 Tax=Pocillopora damicornis TaxID=46731 RepID=A0A3M6UCA6_POCDA|nr:hypothetical protein pdam_00004083 [Pocillopora damicornis]
MADSASLSALQFSGGEKEVIERTVNVTNDTVCSKNNKEEFYEISRCTDVIKSLGFQKFPDSLLTDSAAVSSLIEKFTGKKVFVLADTSYGSCCVDEVAAEHIEADLIIHYGRACLSQTRRLPVLHVFGKWPINGQSCLEQFGQLFPDTEVKVIVFCDVVYSHCMELQNSIKRNYPNVVFTKLICSTFDQEGELSQGNKQTADEFNSQGKTMEETPLSAEPLQTDVEMTSLEEHGNVQHDKNGYFCRFGREFSLPADTQLEDFAVFYIGGESLCLQNLMMTYNKCQFYSYDPCTNIGRKETLNVNKALMKRYYMIQRAKDAQVVGIVVGTLGVADYLRVIERLKQVIKLAGKKSYLFVMGKLNVAKMANFMEVDVFVLVACPENTLIDSQSSSLSKLLEFYKPIVTPFEMELACLRWYDMFLIYRTREWTGDYITDFRELLPGASASVELDVEEGILQGHWLRGIRKQVCQLNTTVLQKLILAKISDLAEYLASRSWRGLEQRLGETPVTQAVEGRTGIAAGYLHEKGQDQGSQKEPVL